jgi:hypothetical protein
MAKFKRFSLGGLVVATALAGLTTVTAADASSPPSAPPSATNVQIQGTSGGSLTPTGSNGQAAAATPTIECTSLYESGDGNYFNQSIDVSYCTSPIPEIYVTATLKSKGSQVAIKSGFQVPGVYVAEPANKNCGSASACKAGNPYSGTGQAIFTGTGYWTGISPGCFVSGSSMICSMLFGPWYWPN